MNVIFLLFLIISITLCLFTAPENVIPSMINGATDAITLSIKLIAIYSVWLSVMKILENINGIKYISKIFSKITDKLFPKENAKTTEYITMNLTANMLGLGGVATPYGIKAIENMYNDKITKNMIMLLVINSTSIQLLPATVIAMRASSGSVSPSNILFPSLISTTVTTAIGILLVKIFIKNDK